MLRFQKKYFIPAILLFVTEVLIAIFLHDKYIRPYFGDFLVVILMYCSIKSLFNIPPWPLAISVLLIAYLLEVLQYFHFLQLFGLQHVVWLNIILGNGFAWGDLVAYTLGIVTVLLLERTANK
ncbi:ribosomal maturation YjgA family protein [Limnovirga soli]|uniref:DUF2809 domain-containing protein n=1 Tax=Limnovirga soli TaxID=2656915 RepID=A0A8J8JRP7_9BACT|nr:DUF2809 domain-containing protein [Limnovirga soli]NNV53838.1 DUF2809 domain-containing protein [Limnovirga soli]